MVARMLGISHEENERKFLPVVVIKGCIKYKLPARCESGEQHEREWEGTQ
jgi:hypothetical protein